MLENYTKIEAILYAWGGLRPVVRVGGGGKLCSPIASEFPHSRHASSPRFLSVFRWSTNAALVSAACLGLFAGPDLANAQQASSPPSKSAFGALPASKLVASSANELMFAPEPMGGILAGKAAPPTSAFAPQDAPDVSVSAAEQAAILALAKRRSQAFIPGRAFVAAAEPVSSPANARSPRQNTAGPVQAQAETAAPPPAGACLGTNTFARRTSVVVDNTIDLPVPLTFSTPVVGDEAIAKVVPIGNRTLNITGMRVGATNVVLYDQHGCRLGEVGINVRLDTGAMAAELRQGAGEQGIRVSEVNGNIVLSGKVSDGLAADRAMRVASGMAPEGKNVVNNLSVASPQQVMLQVRFVEADRQAVRNLGVRWNAFWNNGKSGATIGQNASTSALTLNNTSVSDAVTGAATGLTTTSSPFATILANLVSSKAGSLDVVLSALEEQQVVRRLAEPNLVALSGESADFLAGGEFPVPVSSTTGVGGAPTVTIDYKQFGVRLKFTPTVLADGLVSLKLNSEVSDLDSTIVVQTGGVAVPGISVRLASSTIQLRDGQAFGIAGMLSSKSQRQLDAFPWLGTIPYLGALFSSKQFQNNETELIMLVSPHVIKPMAPNAQIKTPLDTRLASNDIDMFLKQQLEIPKSQPTYVTPNGHAQNLDAGMAPGAPGIQEDPNRWVWPWENTK